MTSTEFGVRLGGGTGGTASGTTGAQIEVFNDPHIMANPLHPIFIDLVKIARRRGFPANLREEEHATALHQTLDADLAGRAQAGRCLLRRAERGRASAVLDQPLA